MREWRGEDSHVGTPGKFPAHSQECLQASWMDENKWRGINSWGLLETVLDHHCVWSRHAGREEALWISLPVLRVRSALSLKVSDFLWALSIASIKCHYCSVSLSRDLHYSQWRISSWDVNFHPVVFRCRCFASSWFFLGYCSLRLLEGAWTYQVLYRSFIPTWLILCFGIQCLQTWELALFTPSILFGAKKISRPNRIRRLEVLDTPSCRHILLFLSSQQDFTLHQAMSIRKSSSSPSSFSVRLASFWVSHMMILKVPSIPKDLGWVASSC